MRPPSRFRARSPTLALAPLLLLLAATTVLVHAQQRIITTAAEVRALSVAEADSGIAAVIRGVVVYVESPSGLFIQDETSTTFFRTQGEMARNLPAVGDEIEIRANTRMGLYLPGLDFPSSLRHLGRRPLPPGIPASYDDLAFGRYHYRRVTVEGTVRSIAPLQERGQTKSLVRLAFGSRVLEVRVEQPPLAGRNLVDHRVRATGLAAGFINARRQLVQPYLGVVAWSDIETLAPAPPASAVPLVSAAELLAFRVTGPGTQRVRIEGVVTAAFSPRELVLQQDHHAFAVHLARPTPAAPGDRVTVVGFPEMDRFSASVADAELVATQPGRAPDPFDLGNPDALAGPKAVPGPFDGALVCLTGILRDIHKTDTGHILSLAGPDSSVQIRIPADTPLPALHARVRVTGICQVESAEGSAGFTSRPKLVGLRARTPEDLEVLDAPPWWTPARLSAALAAVAALTALALLWIVLLRRQVARQTAALADRLQSEAAFAERQRIAREFHDTLEQELAGVSLRLDALASRPLDDKARNLTGAARNLVARIQTETRDLISDLRDAAEISGDLPTALAAVALRHATDSGADVRFESLATPPPLPPTVVHDLRMIARESVNNALKHGRATHVRIELSLADSALLLRIVDNGCGFDPAAATDHKRGHFGCAGIRERARKLGATVAWHSELQRGATVEVTFPLTLPARPRPVALAVHPPSHPAPTRDPSLAAPKS